VSARLFVFQEALSPDAAYAESHPVPSLPGKQGPREKSMRDYRNEAAISPPALFLYPTLREEKGYINKSLE
jgi:hypothetical protein